MTPKLTQHRPLNQQFTFTEDYQLSFQIGKMCQLLINESQNRHALRSRVCHELLGTILVIMEPAQSVISCYPELSRSAMLAGDTGNAMIARWAHIAGGLSTGENIMLMMNSSEKFLQEAVSITL